MKALGEWWKSRRPPKLLWTLIAPIFCLTGIPTSQRVPGPTIGLHRREERFFQFHTLPSLLEARRIFTLSLPSQYPQPSPSPFSIEATLSPWGSLLQPIQREQRKRKELDSREEGDPDGEGFEPPVFEKNTSVFKTDSFNRSDIHPNTPLRLEKISMLSPIVCLSKTGSMIIYDNMWALSA